MNIKAAVLFQENTPFEIRDVELESPRVGEVLVKVKAVGVCHSDWHLASGDTEHPLPVVCGHEGAGIVEAVGEGVDGISPGDPIALNWAPYCGQCFYCQNERPNLCSAYVDAIWAGTMMDGTPRLSLDGEPIFHYCSLACFAEYAVVPQESCIKLDSDIPFEIAALIGCAVTTGVGSVLNTAQVKAGSSVVVFGAGGVGLSTIMGAKLANAEKIIAIDKFAHKADFATSLGATEFLLASESTNDAIRELTDGRGADYVFDTTGVPAVQEASLGAARPGGAIVFSGLAPMGSNTNIPGAILTRQEKTVMGSYYGTSNTARDFPLYADYYREGKLDLAGLITERYHLDQINQAYDEMLAGKLARGVILFG
jgi:NDMA-dependent alcohol dehydrogenase